MKKIVLMIILISSSLLLMAEEKKFSSEKWNLSDAEIINFQGKECLKGLAILKDESFINGEISFKMFVTGKRSFPAIIFRGEDESNSEKIYFRPHKSGLYKDVIQYTPVFNNVSGWQLYHGDGYTAGYNLTANQWNDIKIIIAGKRAELFINKDEKPALIISELQREPNKGYIAFSTDKAGNTFFTDVEIKPIENKVEKAALKNEEEFILTDWQISKKYEADKFDLKKMPLPSFYSVFYADWQDVKSRYDGLVDISKYIKRDAKTSEMIIARTQIYSENTQNIQLDFGYSDEIAIFVNGEKVFYGNSSFRSRDFGFAGIVGYNDAIYVQLQSGINEILILCKENFGGWGFKFKADKKFNNPVTKKLSLEKLWETKSEFLTPESVIYDKKRDILYVSSFDAMYYKNRNQGYISKLDLNGNIIKKKWISGLDAPCGMTICNDKLYTVERNCITEIDIDSNKVINRYELKMADFPNDITSDDEGNIYVSDTGPGKDYWKSKIYRLKDGKVDVWTDTDEVSRANGLTYFNGRLLIGNSGDGKLKSICIKSKQIENVVELAGGILDGIKPTKMNEILVSHWEGKIFAIKDGKPILVDDLINIKQNSADFEFIQDSEILLIPTFTGNKVIAYKLKRGDK